MSAINLLHSWKRKISTCLQIIMKEYIVKGIKCESFIALSDFRSIQFMTADVYYKSLFHIYFRLMILYDVNDPEHDISLHHCNHHST